MRSVAGSRILIDSKIFSYLGHFFRRKFSVVSFAQLLLILLAYFGDTAVTRWAEVRASRADTDQGVVVVSVLALASAVSEVIDVGMQFL
ncbi:MAG: hypothetical protein A3H60_00600 [Candidatus Zambryskibacteria bacterium RIFCSPLOWO2_02_FULL_44_12b]|uniref:Uncharacterized protein n=1 Tax=Candidatus Zambryskibacteria bacterium RIFCSPLOWO2_02_FULL_44_12b TaxID=1802772 RepID=A0A1G2UNF4_9BACT|nr:MAG: hypothetical protein A3H60_00600 [Candidatus Zambryskibacteria bacterium RIFCSPLOWO2_02_FULL_44_12b]